MMHHARLPVLVSMVLLAALARLLPHPPNFTPVAAMALFGGAVFARRAPAYAVPIVAMMLSDLALGLLVYGTAVLPSRPVIYLCFAITVWLGRRLLQHRSPPRIAVAAVGSAAMFFVFGNLGVWLQGHLYPMTAEGLVTCYVAALPFLQNTLLGNAVFCTALFGMLALAERRFPELQATPATESA